MPVETMGEIVSLLHLLTVTFLPLDKLATRASPIRKSISWHIFSKHFLKLTIQELSNVTFGLFNETKKSLEFTESLYKLYDVLRN